MIAEILPDGVVAVEARSDLVDVVPFPEEELALGQAVEKRRREFLTARACAREALRGLLGLPPPSIPSGAHGEPRWPAGVVGSITHCRGYRACSVARASEFVALGIDAEPHDPLPDGVLAEIARAEELPRLAELARLDPGVHWDRLLFSAKESVYKAWFQAWFPLAGRRLGFADAALLIDPRRSSFTARLLVPGPALADGRLTMLSGRWLVRDGLVLTAVALALPSTSAAARRPGSAG
jgi:4'-phosphopantetheinyl transferase EntD